MFNNIWIFILTFTTIVSIACFNSFGIAVTKYASAAQRSTIDTSRTVLIWLFCMLAPTSSPFFSKLHVTFKWLQLIGFILLVFGTLLYNEIIVLPFGGFNTNTKAAIAARKAATQLVDEDEDEDQTALNSSSPGGYMPTSPAGYDQQKQYG